MLLFWPVLMETAGKSSYTFVIKARYGVTLELVCSATIAMKSFGLTTLVLLVKVRAPCSRA